MSALMADEFDDIFRVRPGPPRSRGGGGTSGGNSFRRQVEMAVRKAGGDPRRIGRSAGRGSGRFNARGRGAKLAASFPRENAGWKRYEGGMRFRSRRVVVKARVVKLNVGRGGRSFVTSAKAVDAHLRYLERDGVTRDGEKGRVYSAYLDEADGKAFIERGRADRHQFRFIVAPEDAAELNDLRGFTRDLMRQMEDDLDTRLDWVAIDHHNTGHPHTHILVRGVTDDGKILNIAGDYIAHGIRHRASERLTLELGPQSELEVAQKLAREVDADRLTRLDRMLIAEQRDHDLIDLNPNASDSFTIRANRYLLIDRVRKLERMGLAEEIDTGQWSLSDNAEETLKDLGMRNDIIKTMHRALTAHDLAEERSPGCFEMHGKGIREPIIGRVLAKGLAGDEMSDRLHVVIDGVDGRVHYVEMADAARLNDIGIGHIVALEPVQAKTEPRPADINIRDATDGTGVYRPGRHLELARAKIERIGGDPDAFIRSHVRRLEALRRAGHVERIDADHWKVPSDLPERGIAYDTRNRGKDFTLRTLSAVDLEAQIGSDGATWLDRELVSPDRTTLAPRGFGREVTQALDKRAFRLVEIDIATRDATSGVITFPRGMHRTLERQEVARVGREMANARDRIFTAMEIGDEARGKLVGAANLASGRYAMLDNGHQLHLVPWEPMLEKRIGQTISARVRTTGGIEWTFGRQRGIGIGM
ncbi:DUF3363 domain-containing protein [Nitratireductor luteus]|uniref:DUF3363 domain-containing protein n=1 Tax=Nitratireductor luteus TaxID=2976980 RepID=UPI00223F3BC8|nr:DUF3363 domain-containing protein [Nitratireductor luteus]